MRGLSASPFFILGTQFWTLELEPWQSMPATRPSRWIWVVSGRK